MSVTISRSDLLNAFEKLQSQFNHALSDAQAKDQEFEELRGRFRQNLERRLKDAEKYLPVGNPLAGQVSELLNLISITNQEWDNKIAGRDKGIQFRQGFNDSLLVFVYGKVKSGKSSLGNYVAWGHTDPTDSLKQAVALKPQYFSHERTDVQGGDTHQEAERNSEFRVGATEATSSIQGFRLPGLTWVDSPGLHSVNDENGQLARDYVEHADLILYTMKSDAPGRDSDLKEIKDLFHKDKKTLLILTGSDTTEEDEDDAGNIIKAITMKPSETRAKQREYVQKALNELDIRNVEILSFSARYAQEHEDEPHQFEDSGMGQFFSVLSELIQAQGVAMKRRVPMTNFCNFIGACKRDIVPYHKVLGDFENTVQKLQQKLPKMVSVGKSAGEAMMRQAVNREFDALGVVDDSNKNTAIAKAQKQLNKRCQTIIQEQLTKVFSELMNDFQHSINQDFVQSDLVKLPEFSLETQEQQIPSGMRANTKKRNERIGSLIGMRIGFALGGLGGAVIGGFLGELLGNLIGEEGGVQRITIKVDVSDNFQEIRQIAMSAYVHAVGEKIAKQADKLLAQVLQEAYKLLQDVHDEVGNMEDELARLHADVKHMLLSL